MHGVLKSPLFILVLLLTFLNCCLAIAAPVTTDGQPDPATPENNPEGSERWIAGHDKTIKTNNADSAAIQGYLQDQDRQVGQQIRDKVEADPVTFNRKKTQELQASGQYDATVAAQREKKIADMNPNMIESLQVKPDGKPEQMVVSTTDAGKKKKAQDGALSQDVYKQTQDRLKQQALGSTQDQRNANPKLAADHGYLTDPANKDKEMQHRRGKNCGLAGCLNAVEMAIGHKDGEGSQPKLSADELKKMDPKVESFGRYQDMSKPNNQGPGADGIIPKQETKPCEAGAGEPGKFGCKDMVDTIKCRRSLIGRSMKFRRAVDACELPRPKKSDPVSTADKTTAAGTEKAGKAGQTETKEKVPGTGVESTAGSKKRKGTIEEGATQPKRQKTATGNSESDVSKKAKANSVQGSAAERKVTATAPRKTTTRTPRIASTRTTARTPRTASTRTTARTPRIASTRTTARTPRTASRNVASNNQAPKKTIARGNTVNTSQKPVAQKESASMPYIPNPNTSASKKAKKNQSLED